MRLHQQQVSLIYALYHVDDHAHYSFRSIGELAPSSPLSQPLAVPNGNAQERSRQATIREALESVVEQAR